MAWRTKDGQTSDRQVEAATRRGTEPRTGIRDRSAERAANDAAAARTRETAEYLRNGDFYNAFYRD